MTILFLHEGILLQHFIVELFEAPVISCFELMDVLSIVDNWNLSSHDCIIAHITVFCLSFLFAHHGPGGVDRLRVSNLHGRSGLVLLRHIVMLILANGSWWRISAVFVGLRFLRLRTVRKVLLANLPWRVVELILIVRDVEVGHLLLRIFEFIF